MSIFTFTVACGASPTPTPTPRPTPVPWCCYEYSTFNEGFTSETVYYEDCAGNSQSTSVPTGYSSIPCSKQYSPYSPSGLTYFTEGSQCYTVPNDCESTPTPTPTPTPTSTPFPTPTPPPNYTVAIYAKLNAIPDAIILPGSGTEPQARIYFTFGNPMALQLVGGSITSTSCNFVGNITVPNGTTLRIGMRSYSYNTPIYYNVASGTSTCPTSDTSYCGTFYDNGGTTCYSQVITGNTTLAFSAHTRQYSSDPKFVVDPNLRGKTSLYYCGGTGSPAN
jgi:hypothetical protein